MDKKILMWIIGIALLLPIVSAGKVNYTTYSSCASDSMAPTLGCHDKLIVNTIDSDDLIYPTKIYCYRTSGTWTGFPSYYYVCHRLINVDNKLYTFKGDNNAFADEPVERRFIAWQIINF